MEVVISFDDTGSMASVRAQVRQKIKDLVTNLVNLDSDVKIGILIHLDYCDRDIVDYLDLTNDVESINKFINKKLDGYGGDSDECYELAINYIHSKFSWSSDKKVAILIGDSEPHEVGYSVRSKNTNGTYVNKLDWQDETIKCYEKGIRLYPIQALQDRSANYFYDAIATICDTAKLELSQFAHITQYISGILYSENDQLEQYEETQPEFKTNISLKGMFSKLKEKISSTVEREPYVKIDVAKAKREYIDSWRSSYTPSYRTPARSRRESDIDVTKEADPTATIDIASKFQVLEVGPERKVIRDFVEENGATFTVGRGFYEFIKPEIVQKKKEVLFVNKLTGETKSDTIWCREQLGVPFGTESDGKINPKKLKCSSEYDIYIQSTSYTRKLDANTKFLYELDRK